MRKASDLNKDPSESGRDFRPGPLPSVNVSNLICALSIAFDADDCCLVFLSVGTNQHQVVFLNGNSDGIVYDHVRRVIAEDHILDVFDGVSHIANPDGQHINRLGLLYRVAVSVDFSVLRLIVAVAYFFGRGAGSGIKADQPADLPTRFLRRNIGDRSRNKNEPQNHLSYSPRGSFRYTLSAPTLAVIHPATAGPLSAVAGAGSAIAVIAAALLSGVLGFGHLISPFGCLPASFVVAKGLTDDIEKPYSRTRYGNLPT
jgi:hypothetical protein